MIAGRELDAAIAEKVMGWARVGADWHIKPQHRPSLDRPGEVFDEWDAKGPHDFLIPPGAGIHHRQGVSFCGCEYDGEIPPYSTSIEAAWQVVEQLATDEYWPIYVKSIYRDHAPWFIVTAMLPNGMEVLDEADTAPLAICLAALKAVGGRQA